MNTILAVQASLFILGIFLFQSLFIHFYCDSRQNGVWIMGFMLFMFSYVFLFPSGNRLLILSSFPLRVSLETAGALVLFQASRSNNRVQYGITSLISLITGLAVSLVFLTSHIAVYAVSHSFLLAVIFIWSGINIINGLSTDFNGMRKIEGFAFFLLLGISRLFYPFIMTSTAKSPLWSLCSALLLSMISVSLTINLIIRQKNRISTMERRLLEMPLVDNITGDVNETAFVNEVIRMLDFQKRNNFHLVLIAFELNHVESLKKEWSDKAVNHFILLCSNIINEAVRNMDLVGYSRNGKFYIALPNTKWEQGKIVATRIIKFFENQIFRADNTELDLSVSIGASGTSESMSYLWDDLKKKTDTALYEAKKRGRNKIVLQ